ncbi:MAG: dTDP-4-dehydrorhamnose reductase [Bacteroidetes bacterium]|nr:dTDP-4-dehydrorhamnose reductase [Bacteroidota bacterium]
MNILVTGCDGQLGSELRKLSAGFPQYRFTFIDKQHLDLTDAEKVEAYFRHKSFDGIINCAAYTAVDGAETDPEMAMKLNAHVVLQLGRIMNDTCGWFIQISTDYIFDGKSFQPYKETDRANPCSVYGNTKYAGEKALMNLSARGLILRTSWLYSSYGKNFVKTIYNKGRELKSLRVVFDQIGTPTYGYDLAQVILTLLPRVKATDKMEIFNYSNEGVTSWYDFALAVVEMTGIECNITPIETKDFPTPAARPFYSLLNKSKIKETFGITIPHWRESLKNCIHKLVLTPNQVPGN